MFSNCQASFDMAAKVNQRTFKAIFKSKENFNPNSSVEALNRPENFKNKWWCHCFKRYGGVVEIVLNCKMKIQRAWGVKRKQ